MKFLFTKYQGTGNDFVIIDNRSLEFPADRLKKIIHICDRKMGVGADGFILIEPHKTADFTMRYYNANGHEGSLCGNGSRCAVDYAYQNKICKETTQFMASDGVHKAILKGGIVELEIADVSFWKKEKQFVFLDTGSPHHVVFVDDVQAIDVAKLGAQIAHGPPYFDEGTNVNFAQIIPNRKVYVRTYERGVEGETLSCGTGVTAVALAMRISAKTETNQIDICTKGGNLSVSFEYNSTLFTSVVLKGPAVEVFKGEIVL